MNKEINNGVLKISLDVITSIVTLAVNEIEGAKINEESLTDKLKKNSSVKVLLNDSIADIDVHISVPFGKEIHPLAQEVQENVIFQVESMTNVKVNTVNITVSCLHN